MNDVTGPRSGDLIAFPPRAGGELSGRNEDADSAPDGLVARRHLEDLDMLVRVAVRVALAADDARFSSSVRRRVLTLARSMERGVDALADLVEAEDADAQGASDPRV